MLFASPTRQDPNAVSFLGDRGPAAVERLDGLGLRAPELSSVDDPGPVLPQDGLGRLVPGGVGQPCSELFDLQAGRVLPQRRLPSALEDHATGLPALSRSRATPLLVPHLGTAPDIVPRDAGREVNEVRFETFDANERFVVVRDHEGYGVWRLDDLEEGEPIERFSDDDSGYEAAVERWGELAKAERRSRAPWMRRLKIAVILSAGIWALSSILLNGLFLWNIGLRGPFRAFPQAPIELWGGTIAQASSQVTMALVAVYVVVWLDSRRHQ
jgi:hypothetical protein